MSTESSRDDFIIAIRSAFLKKGNKQRFSLIFLILFSVSLIILGKYNFTAINYFKISNISFTDVVTLILSLISFFEYFCLILSSSKFINLSQNLL